MGVKEYWLTEDALMPTYTHLIDLYSQKLKQEWAVKVEDFQGTAEVKEECEECRVKVEDFGGTSEVKEECEDLSTVLQRDNEIISTKEQVCLL